MNTDFIKFIKLHSYRCNNTSPVYCALRHCMVLKIGSEDPLGSLRVFPGKRLIVWKQSDPYGTVRVPSGTVTETLQTMNVHLGRSGSQR